MTDDDQYTLQWYCPHCGLVTTSEADPHIVGQSFRCSICHCTIDVRFEEKDKQV